MGGPWERYQAAAPAAAGPWTKYGAAPAADAAAPDIVEEMHPQFTTMDRLLVKNLSNDPEAAAAYLRKQHPGLEVKQTDGRILAKAPGESSYRPLDPENGFWGTLARPGELLRDIGDVAFDIPAGIAQGAATAGAGVAGAAAGGIGALPAAALAGGVSGAGIEAIRQALGQMAGVNKDVSGTDVGIAGALGALSPALLGTGASAAKLAAAEVAPETQQGLLGMARDKLAPKVGSFFSGVPEETIKTAKNQYDRMRQVVDQNAINPTVDALVADTQGKLDPAMQDAWKAIEGSFSNPDMKIDLSPAKKELEDHIGQLQSLAAESRTPEITARLAKAQQIRDEFFGGVPEVGRTIVGGGSTDTGSAEASAYETLRKALGGGAIDTAPEAPLRPLEELSSTFTPEAANVVSGRRAYDLQKALENEAEFYKKGFSPSASASDRNHLKSLGNASNAIRQALDDASGGAYGQANAAYGKLAQIKDQIAPFVSGEGRPFKTLSNLANPANRDVYEKALDIDKVLGTKIIDTAKLMDAVKTLGRPQYMALSNGGSSGLAKTAMAGTLGSAAGFYLGSNAGEGHGAGRAGAVLGGLGGAALGGPAAIARYIRMGRLGDKAVAALRSSVNPTVLQAAPASAWQSLLQHETGAN